MIREKVLMETEQEVPHSVAVLIDQWEEGKKLTRISATIYVERSGQKAILIGSKGSTLKQIGILARQRHKDLIRVERPRLRLLRFASPIAAARGGLARNSPNILASEEGLCIRRVIKAEDVALRLDIRLGITHVDP